MQITAAAFAKGLLDLETDNNQLTPILASLVNKVGSRCEALILVLTRGFFFFSKDGWFQLFYEVESKNGFKLLYIFQVARNKRVSLRQGREAVGGGRVYSHDQSYTRLNSTLFQRRLSPTDS